MGLGEGVGAKVVEEVGDRGRGGVAQPGQEEAPEVRAGGGEVEEGDEEVEGFLRGRAARAG